jgi:RES domain-containing protein
MPEAWRIVKEKHAGTAFTGEGAAKTGGRWNSRGVAVVYTSGTKALAALENLVHLNPPVLFSYGAIRIEFEEKFVARVTLADLPPDWRVEPPPVSTKRFGDAWVRAGTSAILALPSVIISGELNFLLNPAHADFNRIVRGTPEAFAFDPRLLT